MTAFLNLFAHNRSRKILFLLALLALPIMVGAQAEHAGEEAGHINYAMTFLAIAVILIAAKVGSLIERFGQPAVLGELVIGVILGNLALLGINFFEPIKMDVIIRFLGELGVVILLFQIGLESNIQKMFKVGVPSLLVATVGVILPFVLGTYVVGPMLMPGMPSIAYMFLGAALTATSVGITARVFQDLGKLQSKEAQIVIGAAVLDDVMGLIILAVVSAIATAGTISAGAIGLISGKALLFLVGAIVLGQMFAPRLGKIFSKIHTGVGMKFTLAICFCLVLASLAQFIGLAPIVGAFAAGLVFDPVHFRYFKDQKIVTDMKAVMKDAPKGVQKEMDHVIEEHSHRHIEYLIEPIGLFLVPIFFVMTGMGVNLQTMFNVPILLVALGITVVAFIGKIAAGAVAGKGVNKWIIGWGMVPRGEVGLIFASIGKANGVVDDTMYSVIVIVVILTTLFTPPVLSALLKRR